MSLGRRLSSIRLRNPFRRQSKAPKSRSSQANTTRTVIEDREAPPLSTCPGNEDESHYKPLKNEPKRKSKCFCCEKRFTALEKILSLGIRKCTTCHRKICKSCTNIGGCHVCGVKRSLDLDPQNLMQIEAKELVAILNTLHFADVNFINWPKEYLIKQLFTRLDVHENWDPAAARMYRVRTDDTSATREELHNTNTDLNEQEDMPGHNSKKEFSEERATVTQAEVEETPSGKCAENSEEGPECSKLEQVRQKQQEDPARQDVAGIPNEDLCKICMDFPVNCILLNCGHVVVCIYCSDLIQECPICRNAIVRVIQTKLT